MVLADTALAQDKAINSFSRGWQWYKSGGDILLFIGISLTIALFVGQERIISRGEPMYWTIVSPAVLLPMLRLRSTIENLGFGAARPLAFFGIVSCGWSVVRLDFNAAIPVLLFVWVAGWATRTEVKLRRAHLFALTLAFYGVACTAYYSQKDYREFPWLMTHSEEPRAAAEAEVRPTSVIPDQQRGGLNLNPWGVLPGQSAPAYQPWRVSATPNIATSGIFSLIVLLVALFRIEVRPFSVGALISTAYFAILSFVRSVFVGLGLFSVSVALMRILPNPRLKVVAAFALMAGVALFVALSPVLLFYLQDFEFVSRLFLRGQNGLSIADIGRQAYRPWLWWQHAKLFWSSPYLMGLGSELDVTATTNIINAGHARSDSVSLLTRLLAAHGVATIGIFWYFCKCCYTHAKSGDGWAVAALVVIIWLMTSWGSVFHPTNGIFVLSFLIVARGSAAFADDWTEPPAYA